MKHAAASSLCKPAATAVRPNDTGSAQVEILFEGDDEWRPSDVEFDANPVAGAFMSQQTPPSGTEKLMYRWNVTVTSGEIITRMKAL